MSIYELSTEKLQDRLDDVYESWKATGVVADLIDFEEMVRELTLREGI